MMFFLQLVGAMLLALIILVIAVYLYVRYKIRKFIKDIAEGFGELSATVPPFRIKLTSREQAEDELRDAMGDDDEEEEFFMDEDSVEKHSKSFVGLGFRPISDFNTDTVLNLRVLVHDQNSTFAVIYDHYSAGVWCDLYRGYRDGASWTYSSAKDPGMDIMPGHTQRFFPDVEVEEIAKQFWAQAPSDGIEIVADAEFARYFEKKYAEGMNWKIQRGGPTEEEIRRVAELSGDECTEEAIRSTQEQWATEISGFLGDLAIKQFNKQNDVSKQDAADREFRVFAVHERMPTQELLESIHQDFYLDMDEDLEDDEEEDPDTIKWRREFDRVSAVRESKTVIETFHAVLEESGKRDTYECLGAVSKPVEAEIWLRPYDEEDEEFEDDDELDDFEL
ncbi:MAG: hypothetical protein AAFU85_03085 [Planctomycetota bacterium]